MNGLKNVLDRISSIAPALVTLVHELQGYNRLAAILREGDIRLLEVVAEFMRDYRLEAFQHKIGMFFGDRKIHEIPGGEGEALGFSTKPGGGFEVKSLSPDEYAKKNTFLILGMDSGGKGYAKSYAQQVSALFGAAIEDVLLHDHAMPMAERIAMVSGVVRDPDYVHPSAVKFAEKAIMPRIASGDLCQTYVVHSFAGIFFRAVENAVRHLCKKQGMNEEEIQQKVFNPMRGFSFGCAPVFHDEYGDRARAHIPTVHVSSFCDMAMPRQPNVQGLMLGGKLPEGRTHILTQDPFQKRRVSLVFGDTPHIAYGKFINVCGHGMANYIAACHAEPEIWAMMTDMLAGARRPLSDYGLQLDVIPPLVHDDSRVANRWLTQLGQESALWGQKGIHPLKQRMEEGDRKRRE